MIPIVDKRQLEQNAGALQDFQELIDWSVSYEEYEGNADVWVEYRKTDGTIATTLLQSISCRQKSDLL